jgi:hypothetical protein
LNTYTALSDQFDYHINGQKQDVHHCLDLTLAH